MTLSNKQLSELLASASEHAEGNKQKALLRASTAALMWPREASVAAEHDLLTELAGVGPWIASVIQELLADPPEVPDVPEIRRDCLTYAEVNETLEEHRDWQHEIRGDLQMHSRYSDGSVSIREMAFACTDFAYDYIAITDHSKGLKIAGGIDEARLVEQADEIERVNVELRESGSELTVLRSMEVNLSPTGEGDMESGALRQLDLVLGSFHSQLRKKEDQTERYLAGLRNPDIQILGHPRGRIYNRRVGLSADWKAVFEEAARLDKAVEIDGYPDRQDLNVELLELARETGVCISMSTDSHAPWELQFIDFALAAALRAGVPKERIVNFSPLDDLLAWVDSVRTAAGA